MTKKIILVASFLIGLVIGVMIPFNLDSTRVILAKSIYGIELGLILLLSAYLSIKRYEKIKDGIFYTFNNLAPIAIIGGLFGAYYYTIANRIYFFIAYRLGPPWKDNFLGTLLFIFFGDIKFVLGLLIFLMQRIIIFIILNKSHSPISHDITKKHIALRNCYKIINFVGIILIANYLLLQIGCSPFGLKFFSPTYRSEINYYSPIWLDNDHIIFAKVVTNYKEGTPNQITGRDRRLSEYSYICRIKIDGTERDELFKIPKEYDLIYLEKSGDLLELTCIVRHKNIMNILSATTDLNGNYFTKGEYSSGWEINRKDDDKVFSIDNKHYFTGAPHNCSSNGIHIWDTNNGEIYSLNGGVVGHGKYLNKLKEPIWF